MLSLTPPDPAVAVIVSNKVIPTFVVIKVPPELERVGPDGELTENVTVVLTFGAVLLYAETPM
jgi:hypothetical protein